MAFDTKTRNRLNQFVGDARGLLTEEFTQQCQVEFGMNPETGEVTELERLSHLDDAQRQTAIILRETLNHYYANLPTKQKDQAKDYQSLIQRIVREQAFTILNRLCAIRMAEARDLVIESIGAGVQSKGFQLYQYAVGNSLGETGAAYQQYLLSLFDEFGVDLPVLFDRYSPQGRLFPRETVLTELIGMINDPEINRLWAEDETIGWIYQYFNSKEERKAMRDASQAPRNSRELAVRNQFFTPRYVVEFLTDNTLGRIWYEMRKGETGLKESCQYLVRRPNEFFLPSLADYSVEEKFSGASEMKAFWASANPDELPDNPSQIVIFDWLGRIAPDKNANEELGFESCLDQSHQDFMAQWMEALPSPNYVEWIEQQNALNLMHALWRSGVQASRAQTYPLDPILNNEEAGPLWTRLLELLRQKGKEYSQEDLLNQPVFIPHRPLKDPREIRMLDPACGSMHFGLYAFDLYLKIYEEFWDLVAADPSVAIEPTELSSLAEAYESRDAFLRDVPRLIIEHNIHGIDIDPRAVQIAGLSLWLRAQRAWKSQDIAAADRPQVTRSNIVCAEPMPGDQDQLAAFCQTLHPAIAQMVTAIFEEMKLAGEAGSLLKIEEEISSLVTRAKEQWQQQPKEVQQELFGGASKPVEQQGEFDLSGITDQQFFEQAEETIYEALRKYASETSEGGFRRKLFAGDAEKGFAFIELCRKRFDAVLMNPPFGEVSLPSRSYLYEVHPESSRDIFAAFVSVFVDRLSVAGALGAITNRLAFFNEFLSDWRKEVLCGSAASLSVMADLGYGVLDAVVETAAYVTYRHKAESGVFFDFLKDKEKGENLLDEIHSVNGSRTSERTYVKRFRSFDKLPGCRFAYSITNRWLDSINAAEGHNCFSGKGGICTGDDFRFYRTFWEINRHDQGSENWRFLAKGGAFSRYRTNTHLVIDWNNKPLLLRTKNYDLYGLPGANYTYRTTSNLSARIHNKGVCFSQGGPALVASDPSLASFVLAYINSFAATYCLELIVGGGDSSVKGSAARNLEPRYLEHTPEIDLDTSEIGWFDERVEALNNALCAIDDDEAHPLFLTPQLETIASFAEFVEQSFAHAFGRIREAYEIVAEINERIAALLGFSEQDVRLTFSDTGWPLPEGDLSPEGCVALRESGISPIPRDDGNLDYDEDEIEFRFQNKLSHYIHADVEKLSHKFSASPLAVCNAAIDSHQITIEFSQRLAKNIISLLLGTALGRWDLRCLSIADFAKLPVSPFDELPPCPLSMLTLDSVPVSQSTCPQDYPLEIFWNGILSNDGSQGATVYSAVQLVSKELWGDNANDIESELLNTLAIQNFAEYFDNQNHFFADHLSRYSKSRRNAPIYWPISTESGSYTLWFYYHRLTDQTLYKAVNDFVDPKLKQTNRQLADLRAIQDRSSAQEKELDQLTELESELEQFKADLLEIAAFWKPNLNDGVQITAAPLHKFFRLKKWRDKLATTWKDLQDGKYDWAHLSLSIWPDRVVREKCTTDRSIAIAHDLEEQLWHKVEVEKTSKRGRVTKKMQWMPKELTETELDAIIESVKSGKQPANT